MIRTLTAGALVSGGLILLSIVGCGRKPAADRLQPQPKIASGQASSPQCIAQAGAQIPQWKSAGKTESEIERLYQAELARCSGAESDVANFVGALNFDWARAGRLFLSDQLDPTAYLSVAKDRGRKLRWARRDGTWVKSFAAGDKDGDLVPDDRDQCPDTKDLTPTDEHGCPREELTVAGPSTEEVKKAKAALKVALSPACKDAPLPTVSEPLQIGIDPADEDSFLISVTKVTNQPPGCTIFYEISLQLHTGSFFTSSSSDAAARVVFRGSENIDTSPAAQQRQIFRIRKAGFPAWRQLASVAIEGSDSATKRISVRATNGNGYSSGWSGATTYSSNFWNWHFPGEP